jgi:hypothetical protein
VGAIRHLLRAPVHAVGRFLGEVVRPGCGFVRLVLVEDLADASLAGLPRLDVLEGQRAVAVDVEVGPYSGT